ncbi:sporulation protein YlmC with PRC-barrel domain [Bradyrhizobium sp. LB14.3]|uniref:hypothetical protein n=1 Tax=Bradyrhizobium sp. LB14.3 TaxID=3156328 RepID=UPI0033955EF7
MFSLKGEYLGAVRNVTLADDGQIDSLLVEGFRTKNEPEFISRIPFNRVLRPLHEGAIVADFSDLRSREYGLFVDTDQAQAEPHEFSVSKVIGRRQVKAMAMSPTSFSTAAESSRRL